MHIGAYTFDAHSGSSALVPQAILQKVSGALIDLTAPR